MRLFWEVVKRSFQRQMTYRTANLAGLATNLFFGFLRASVMIALYGAQTQVSGVSIEGAVTYTGLTQSIIVVLSMFSWYELMKTINTGDIAMDLLKPMGLFRYWLAVDFGRATASFIMRSVPLMAAFAMVYQITLPTRLEQWLAFLVSLLLAWMVSFSWRFLVNLAAFWSTNAMGIGRLLFGLALFLSGFLMPLRFFPDWFVRLAYLTPFPAMINVLVEVYLGVLTGPEIISALAFQLVWFLILTGVGQLVLRAGMRSLIIQGG